MNYEDTVLQNKINQGIKLIEVEKYPDAIKIFEELKKNKKTKLIGLMFLGIIHIKKEEPSKAKSNFYKIIEIDKKHKEANLNLGLIFFKEKNYERSEFYFDKVISFFPNAPISLANSAATISDSKYHYDMVRTGLILYIGNQSLPTKIPLNNSISLKTHIINKMYKKCILF